MGIERILYSKRKELNLTQKQVAEAVGVDNGTVSRWESGDISNMRRDRIYALAKILELEPSIIMGWDETKITLTPKEGDLIIAYRNQPEIQPAVDRLLGIETPPLQYTKAKMIAGDDVDAETVTQGSYDERAALAEELNGEE